MGDRIRALDGVRAMAVFLVLLFHGMGNKFPVGWIGVDIFFVLSGYLITGLLLREADRDRIDLIAFYVRRAARLFPALLLTVVLCLAVSAPVTLNDVLASVTYLADIARWRGHDVGALGHTWSLAIEEHFYLLWPLVLIFAKTRRRIAMACGIGLLLSLATMLILSPGSEQMAESTYNAPHARMWELLSGCLLSCLSPHIRRPRVTAWWGFAVAAFAALCLAVVAGGWPERTAYLMVAGVVTAASLILLISVGGARLLALRPLPDVGLVSYGVYLFHFPIFLSPHGPFGPRAIDLAARGALTLALAFASYWFIEVRILKAARNWCRSRTEARSAQSRDLHDRVRSKIRTG